MKKIMLVLLMLLQVTSSLANDNDQVLAYWEPQQIRFKYISLSTFYTCDGLERKLKKLLEAIGARKDARVEARCNTPSNYRTIRNTESRNVPLRINEALLAFAIPVYADVGSTATDVYTATWEEVKVNKRNPNNLDGGDCELVEAFHKQVVEKLNIEVLDERIRCLAYQRSITAPSMTLKMLSPVNEQADIESRAIEKMFE